MKRNRLLIEEVYPDLTPKYSNRKRIFSDKYLRSVYDQPYEGSEATYSTFIEIDGSTVEELEDICGTL